MGCSHREINAEGCYYCLKKRTTHKLAGEKQDMKIRKTISKIDSKIQVSLFPVSVLISIPIASDAKGVLALRIWEG